MLQTALLSFAAAALAGNGFPHFVKGITKEHFPTVFADGPVVNFLAGWASALLVGGATVEAHVGRHPAMAATLAAAGLLVAGLFHSAIGAFGRRPTEDSPSGTNRQAPSTTPTTPRDTPPPGAKKVDD